MPTAWGATVDFCRAMENREMPMRKMPLAALAFFLTAATIAPGTAQQKRWAALDPNNETSSPVAWGANEEEARRKAIEACKRVSETCANGPAVTDDMREVFALVCCAKPKAGCAASAAANKRDAQRNAQKMFADAGYSECAVRHYLHAGSGKRQ
jgi:hypothetical protein